MKQYDVVIIGAGVLGLAHALQAAKRGLKTCVIEKDLEACSASVRNFGMVWPIGQPPGEMREIALRSREIWVDTLEKAGIWHRLYGSLHVAYQDDELAVLEEFHQKGAELGYETEILTPSQTLQKSPLLRQSGLKGALWSSSEVCVNPRTVIGSLPGYLESLGVEFRFGESVLSVEEGKVITSRAVIGAAKTYVCTGDQFEALFPEFHETNGLVRCKLQMMKARLKSGGDIGAHLCAGLTLAHYANFRICEGLPSLIDRYKADWPDQMKWGIHLLVSQHEDGTLTIGDSHEYNDAVSPFNRADIDQWILDYLDTFLPVDEIEVIERWHGVYAKHSSLNYIIHEPAPNVKIVTGVGGAGMTLSFGLAEKAFRLDD